MDPRTGRHPRHYFGEIIFIALAAMICGSEGFDDFERFARARESWLRKRLKLPGGLPSDDTFRRVFTAIHPDKFCECFAAFVLAISGRLRRQLIAIDGKTLRHSFDNAAPGTSLHLISAWAADNQLTLGQLAVDGKSNEWSGATWTGAHATCPAGVRPEGSIKSPPCPNSSTGSTSKVTP